MSSTRIYRSLRTLVIAGGLTVAPLALAAPEAPVAAAPAVCEGLDLVQALSGLTSGPNVRVERRADALELVDVRSGQALVVAHCGGLTLAGPEVVQRPEPGQPTRALETRKASGEKAWTHVASARGARVTVIEPGEVNATGLHVVAFDSGDVHVTDGRGLVMFATATLADGTYVERQHAAYGCGCERRTAPDGVVTEAPLPTPTRAAR